MIYDEIALLVWASGGTAFALLLLVFFAFTEPTKKEGPAFLSLAALGMLLLCVFPLMLFYFTAIDQHIHLYDRGDVTHVARMRKSCPSPHCRAVTFFRVRRGETALEAMKQYRAACSSCGHPFNSQTQGKSPVTPPHWLLWVAVGVFLLAAPSILFGLGRLLRMLFRFLPILPAYLRDSLEAKAAMARLFDRARRTSKVGRGTRPKCGALASACKRAKALFWPR